MAETATGQLRYQRLITIFALGLVSVGIGGGALLIYLDSRPKQEVPIIRADPTPLRIIPEDKGGLQLDNTQSPALGLLEGLADPESEGVTLRPPEAEPELPPVDTVISDAAAPADNDAMAVDDTAGATISSGNTDENPTSPEAETAAAPTDLAMVSPDLVAPQTPQPDSDDTVNTTSETGGKPAEEIKEEASSPADNTTLAMTKPVAENLISENTASPTASSDEDVAGDSDNASPDSVQSTAAVMPPLAKPELLEQMRQEGPLFRVQLAAYSTEKKANTNAALLSAKHRSRLGGVDLRVSRVEAGSRVFWRIVSVPLPRQVATGLCDQLKSSGQDCILRKFGDG